MPRLGKDKVDYNLAMDPALKEAGKICAAAEGRDLATLLRFLLRQHIERHGDEEAQHIYSTGAQIPHGTRIDRFGKKKETNLTWPGELHARAQALAHWEERSLNSLVLRAVERYLDASQATAATDEPPDDEPVPEHDVPRNHRGEPEMF